MALHALDVAHRILDLLGPVIDVIARKDPDLARQMRRAGQSMAMNVSEGRARMGRDRIQLWRIAAGSTAEVATALRIALAWRYVAASDELLALLDRERAMLYRMTH